MLDTITKRRIDTARDILVGKVPDPKSQVEQITIALIYKFMDDMDLEAEELGGIRSFFTGDYEKYSWHMLFDPTLSGFEVLALYSEALLKLSLNPALPQLFRDIFKNAYLPYRDPEILKSFIKIINDFRYDHSEQLGDAFEYLLSVLGSQGDAGQFRTPRHIIDFMVELIDPQKQDRILDPACGTAGFLISSYKHIWKNNSSNYNPVKDKPVFEIQDAPIELLGALNGKGYNGDKLTPDERARLTDNICGFDISPDMVRLSLVNLYLHGFTEPHIYEYDTLTSEERWNEYYDVIMANPPFMSPKGGIRPHKRFSVESNRSEVLFVDYIAEHLTPTGRAAIIVPEGIIFQSGSAYKKLRKMLVEENYLVGVISLPAGVFNPYSGVKTSILWIDKTLARKTDKILFVKISNDGFDLGAQRRNIKLNDLPDAFQNILEYRNRLENCEKFDISNVSNLKLVDCPKLAKNGEYNFNADRFNEIIQLRTHTYELLKLDDVCEINPESGNPTELFGSNQFVYIDISAIDSSSGKISYKNKLNAKDAPSRARRIVKNGDVIISTVRPNLKAFAYLEKLPVKTIASTGFAVLRAKSMLDSKFLYYTLLSDLSVAQMIGKMGKGAYPSINQKDVSEIQIPLPPLSIQQEIVSEIESYQKIIDGARQVVENYKPRIDIDPDWEMVELGETYKNLDGKRVPITKSDRSKGVYPYYGASGIVDYVESYLFDEDLLLVSEDGANLLARSTPIAFSVSGKIWVNNHAHVLKFDNIATQKFIELYLNSIPLDIFITGAAQPKLNQKALNSIPIPYPSLEIQQQIVNRINEEKQLVSANKRLIELYEQKIKNRIKRVWGE